MASIYLDSQTHNWKCKCRVNGSDKRIRLRRATAAERAEWDAGGRAVPPDVRNLAAPHTAPPDFRSEKAPVPVAVAAVAVPEPVPEDLTGFSRWYERGHARHLRPGSATRLRMILTRLRTFIGTHPLPLSAVDAAFLERFFEWRRSQGLQPHVVVGQLELLGGLFRAAVECGFIVKSPLAALLPRLRKAYPHPSKIKYLDSDQVAAFLVALDKAVADRRLSPDLADLYRVMLSTGMRVSAACALEYSWISGDWQVAVPANLDKGKTGYTAGVSPLGRAVLARRRAESGGTGRVFPPGVHREIAYKHLKRKFGVHPHQLRHSFATGLVDAGVAIQTIGSLLGQRTLAITARYAQVRDAAKQAAVGKLQF